MIYRLGISGSVVNTDRTWDSLRLKWFPTAGQPTILLAEQRDDLRFLDTLLVNARPMPLWHGGNIPRCASHNWLAWALIAIDLG